MNEVMELAQNSSTIPENERMINNEAKLLENFEVGDVSYQGDLILVRIAELPSFAKKSQKRQLASGNTPGSRHVLKRGQVYSCGDRMRQRMLAEIISQTTGCFMDSNFLGPIFVSPEVPTCDDLTHPEHGNQGFPAGAVIAVVFQRTWDKYVRQVLD